MSAYPGRDGFEDAPSGVVWQTNADGVTEGIDTAGAADGDVATWNPDLFGTGLGGWERRAPSAGSGIPAPDDPDLGDTLYYDGSAWVRLPRGFPGQVLTMSDTDVPMWGTLSAGVIRDTLRSPDGSPLLSPDSSTLTP